MKPTATPTADEPTARLATYERTGSDGREELVLYNPEETHEWINAGPESVVELEEYR